MYLITDRVRIHDGVGEIFRRVDLRGSLARLLFYYIVQEIVVVVIIVNVIIVRIMNTSLHLKTDTGKIQAFKFVMQR